MIRCLWIFIKFRVGGVRAPIWVDGVGGNNVFTTKHMHTYVRTMQHVRIVFIQAGVGWDFLST